MKLFYFNLLVGLLAIGCFAQDDGGCPDTGMTPFDYSQALCMSFLFYEAQRSGVLPPDKRVTWRKDSALTDGQDVGHDLIGGYYDAGDYVKFGFPLSFTVATLSWGMLEYPNGYERAGQTEYGRAAIKWATDYLFKCHNYIYDLYGQVGDGDLDHAFWGRPEDMTMPRPAWKINSEAPGSDLAGETAAGLAAASMVFRAADPSYADELLNFATEMFHFADDFRDLYNNSIPNASAFYGSYSGYGDELAWGAAWMYKATGDPYYMDKAVEYINEFNLLDWADLFYWDDKKAGVYALMAELNGDQIYIDHLTAYVDNMISNKPYTPQGLIFLNHWGSNRHAANVAFIALKAASLGINTDSYRAWAQSQADVILGSSGHSFVVGFGINPPNQPHHRASSCEDAPAPCDYSDEAKPGPNPHVLFGAVVGGPNDQFGSWVDNRTNYEQNEVGLDYNSCYSGVLAALIELH